MRIKPTGSMYKSLSVKVQLELSTNREALPNADELDELTESDEEVEEVQDGITEIANENGIPALVDLMSNRNALPLAKEHAAAAVYHLAIDPQSRELVAHKEQSITDLQQPLGRQSTVVGRRTVVKWFLVIDDQIL